MVKKNRPEDFGEDLSGFLDEDDYCPKCGSANTVIVEHDVSGTTRLCIKCEHEYEV